MPWDRLAVAHRVGVVAFHDRNAEPVILAFPTTDRDFIRAEVLRFAESGFDSGSSRLWDAVARGFDLFAVGDGPTSDVTRALVFLSDGRDTSSLQTQEDVVLLAQEKGVQLYALGLGDVYQESALRALATATNGAYYAVAELGQLETQFTALVSDFAGQYKLSYTTLRRSGAYAVRIETNLNGTTGVYASALLPFGEIYSPDTVGRIAVDPPTVDAAEQTATTFVRALHVPRNIQHIRFTLPIDRPATVSLVSADEGGLLEGWGTLAAGMPRATGPLPGRHRFPSATSACFSKWLCPTWPLRRWLSPSSSTTAGMSAISSSSLSPGVRRSDWRRSRLPVCVTRTGKST